MGASNIPKSTYGIKIINDVSAMIYIILYVLSITLDSSPRLNEKYKIISAVGIVKSNARLILYINKLTITNIIKYRIAPNTDIEKLFLIFFRPNEIKRKSNNDTPPYAIMEK